LTFSLNGELLQLSASQSLTIDLEEFFGALSRDVATEGFCEETTRLLLASTYQYNFLKLLMELLSLINTYAAQAPLEVITNRLKVGRNIKEILIQLLLQPKRHALLLYIDYEELALQFVREYFPDEVSRVCYLQQLSDSASFFASSSFSNAQPNEGSEDNEYSMLEWLDRIVLESEQAVDLCDVECPLEDVSPLEMLRLLPILLSVSTSPFVVERETRTQKVPTMHFRVVNMIRRILCCGKFVAQHELLTACERCLKSAFPWRNGDQETSLLEVRLRQGIECQFLRYNPRELLIMFTQPEMLIIMCWTVLRNDAFTSFQYQSNETGCDPDANLLMDPPEPTMSEMLSSLALNILSQSATMATTLEISSLTLIVGRCLHWLKAVWWQKESERDRQILKSVTGPPPLDNLEKFIRACEDSVFRTVSETMDMSSTSSTAWDMYVKTLLLGNFHIDATIRRECGMFLCKHVLGQDSNHDDDVDWLSHSSVVRLTQDWQTESTRDQVRQRQIDRESIKRVDSHTKATRRSPSSKEKDIEEKRNSSTPNAHQMRKNEIDNPSQPPSRLTVSLIKPLFKSSFAHSHTHTDLRKLCVLVWDEGMESGLRVSAMQQLRESLEKEQDLLCSCAEDWIQELLSKLLTVVENVWSFSISKTPTESNKNCSIISNERLLTINKIENDMCIHALSLMLHIICVFPTALELFAFHFSSMNVLADVDITTVDSTRLLSLSLAVHRVYQANETTLCEGIKLCRRSSGILTNILHELVLDARSWTLPCATGEFTNNELK
jgi:hypothetical protein